MFVLTTRRQGDLGEVSALDWLMRLGVFTWIGAGICRAPLRGRSWANARQERKTCASRRRGPNGGGSYQVQLATRGGNQSWGGTSKLFDTSRCDYVFVAVGDGRRLFIPAVQIVAKHGIVVGGAAWRHFEVEARSAAP